MLREHLLKAVQGQSGYTPNKLLMYSVWSMQLFIPYPDQATRTTHLLTERTNASLKRH